MELKDIVLKKGDKITFSNKEFLVCNDLENWSAYDAGLGELIKIERPVKYETIYEAPKEILDKEEKEYLEAVIRPFRDRVVSIEKRWFIDNEEKEFIKIWLVGTIDFNEYAQLPSFEKDTMYKGMELNKEYTLDELGLFKE